VAFVVHVDSSSDIPQNRAAAAGIKVTPMSVTIGGTSYFEGVDLFPAEFYTRFPTLTELPKTSQPNPEDLLSIYERILAEGHEVVSILLSSGLSSTVQAAQLARSMASAPERIHIVDSLGASFGCGLIALQAAEILRNASSYPVVEPEILRIRDHMRYIFTPDTLEYLVKGGRVSRTAGLVGGLLDIKPLLQITPEGRIEPFGKIRSRRAAIRKLAEVMAQEIADPEQQIIGISHSNCLEDAQILVEEIRSRVPVQDIYLSDIGCVIGSHTGPGTLALFYQRR